MLCILRNDASLEMSVRNAAGVWTRDASWDRIPTGPDNLYQLVYLEIVCDRVRL